MDIVKDKKVVGKAIVIPTTETIATDETSNDISISFEESDPKNEPYIEPKVAFHIKALEQENAELRQMVMAQHKSADLKMRCVEAVVKTDMHKGIDFIIDAAEAIFKYVSGQE